MCRRTVPIDDVLLVGSSTNQAGFLPRLHRLVLFFQGRDPKKLVCACEDRRQSDPTGNGKAGATASTICHHVDGAGEL